MGNPDRASATTPEACELSQVVFVCGIVTAGGGGFGSFAQPGSNVFGGAAAGNAFGAAAQQGSNAFGAAAQQGGGFGAAQQGGGFGAGFGAAGGSPAPRPSAQSSSGSMWSMRR